MASAWLASTGAVGEPRSFFLYPAEKVGTGNDGKNTCKKCQTMFHIISSHPQTTLKAGMQRFSLGL